MALSSGRASQWLRSCVAHLMGSRTHSSGRKTGLLTCKVRGHLIDQVSPLLFLNQAGRTTDPSPLLALTSKALLLQLLTANQRDTKRQCDTHQPTYHKRYSDLYQSQGIIET